MDYIELQFALLTMIMLVLIIIGVVAWCVLVNRKAQRAINRSEALYDAQNALERAMEELEEKLSTLKREAAEKPTERDERAEEIERQIEEQRNFQLKDYGMRFDGRDNG